jgi:hypothetical protein
MSPDNPMLIFVQKQLHQITQIRIGGIIVFLLIGFLYAASFSEKFEFYEFYTATTTSTHTPVITLTETPTQVTDPIKTSTHTDIPSITLTNTSTPTPTIVPFAYGKLLATYFKPYDEPNENILDITVKRNQFLTILSTKESHGALWYECVWEVDGVTSKGWIPAKNIKIVLAPTPTP